jgi:predicted DNA-binding transcriptional regulator AlpA
LLAAVRAGSTLSPAGARQTVHAKDLLSLKDLAGLTGLGVSTLERLRARGDLPPAIVVCGKLLYRRADVESWLAEHTEAETARARKRY